MMSKSSLVLFASCFGGAFGDTASSSIANLPGYTSSQITGSVTLTDTSAGVAITGRLTGLDPNQETGGFHIHPKTNCNSRWNIGYAMWGFPGHIKGQTVWKSNA